MSRDALVATTAAGILNAYVRRRRTRYRKLMHIRFRHVRAREQSPHQRPSEAEERLFGSSALQPRAGPAPVVHPRNLNWNSSSSASDAYSTSRSRLSASCPVDCATFSEDPLFAPFSSGRASRDCGEHVVWSFRQALWSFAETATAAANSAVIGPFTSSTAFEVAIVRRRAKTGKHPLSYFVCRAEEASGLWRFAQGSGDEDDTKDEGQNSNIVISPLNVSNSIENSPSGKRLSPIARLVQALATVRAPLCGWCLWHAEVI